MSNEIKLTWQYKNQEETLVLSEDQITEWDNSDQNIEFLIEDWLAGAAILVEESKK